MTDEKLKEGTKYDEGKLRWDLIPFDALEETVKVYTSGAQKYDDWNWAKGIKFHRVFRALMSHLMKWWWHKRDINEEDFGCHHLAHVAWNALALLHYALNYERYKEYDDRR